MRFITYIKPIIFVVLICTVILLFSHCKRSTEKDTKTTSVSSNGKPNVIFILADDLGLNDLSYTGSTFYETPNIDRIAKEGAVFTQGYATSRVCSPSRASIMLGKFTARHGITDWIGAASGTKWRTLNRNDKLLPATYVQTLPKEDITLAEAMKKSGYTTFFAGKWHLGEKGSYPEDHGFDVNAGGWEVGSPKGGYFSPWNNPNLDNKTKGEHLSMRLAKETTNFITQHRDSSFFVFLSFYAVHGPIQSTEEKWKKYRDKAEKQGIKEYGYQMERVLPIRIAQDNPIYAGLIESMDDAVGHVLNTLKALDLEKNTIIIFTSDNGGVASGDAFSTTNLPLRGGKGYQWEGGLREPFFIKVPWMQNHNGTSIHFPVTGSDLYPTILDLANLKLLPEQHVDGISLKPLLKGEKINDRPLFWHYPHYGNQGGEPASIIRDGHWKLIHYWEDQRQELYNLQSDPGEQQDVASIQPEITSKLSAQLHAFLKATRANVPLQDPAFNSNLAKKRHREKVTQLMPMLEQERKRILSKEFQPDKTWWGSRVTKD